MILYFTHISALYEYLGATLVLTMPAGLVCAGWPAMPGGQTGYGSTPASLDSLKACAVDLAHLKAPIDKLFRLHEFSPPHFMEGGELRPAVEIAFATLIMYYEERCAAGEMRQVQVPLCWFHTMCLALFPNSLARV